MSRIAAALLALAPLPAAAWDFSPLPICTLTHSEPGVSVTVTHDAAIPEYTITLTRDASAWPEGPTFGLRFDGPAPLTIGTTQHVLTDAGRSLTVTDTGFGNVLDGLQFNDSATALTGADAVTFSLDGAAEPVAAFRACPAPVTS